MERSAGTDQPVTIYFAHASLRRVLDLTNKAVIDTLGLDENDLFRNWRRAKRPTSTQFLGLAATETGLFSAIRFPSNVAGKRGIAGVNFVVFRNCVRSPDSVRILGPDAQEWP